MRTTALFLFHRDLRLIDNLSLEAAFSDHDDVVACFIFDPRQIADNPYFGEHSLTFMLSSLEELEAELRRRSSRLHLFHGTTHDVVDHILSENRIHAVYSMQDYTPFSRERGKQLIDVCTKHDAAFHQVPDALLIDVEAVMTTQGTPFRVFTPFHREALTYVIPEPRNRLPENYSFKELPMDESTRMNAHSVTLGAMQEQIHPGYTRDHAISADAGRKSALRILRNLEQFEDYSKDKDIPAKDATTHLSAHIKFGTCSLREIYHAIKGTREDHPLLRQLYWHDFFTYVAHHFPHVFGSPFRSKYKELEWDKGAQAEKRFRSWCKGNTGFPIVDAGMRQLNTSGFMHNRVRMIVASFLIKDLHIDWRQGERYFAKRLMDYDPAVNNGNWQWAASTGCDAQPYFRIFNPWRQQKRFDPECIYIKEWVPELQELDPAHIHQWSTECKEYWHKKVAYPAPIVCHDEERDEAKARYASVQ